MYFSDRPCSGQLVYGATPNAGTPPSRPIPGVGEAPRHLQYMSPRCASLNDALRTAAARGLKYETVATMRRDYRAECGENENDARTQLSRDAGAQRQQQVAERQMQAAEQERAALHQQQCDESKRILVTKRNRPGLTDGERAELARFEDNYKARCAR
ncbi:hypothetical protein HK414_01540 [Ramlibacter terrae]|uniref:DUF4124 domain-containing protein n=1 Tax=Ramlibacter terrae TaxID=2732511 RepID=A0ABX6P1T2_9BURK|nr:hypothetical protein HK414_01540 [Ramlibacter terrae]